MTTRILFVCLGNICRSPAAEGIARALMPELVIDSAGTSDWHLSEPPYGPMQAAARSRGIDLAGLRARQFEPCDFHRFDLILAMDGDNLHRIEALRPEGSETSVRLFTDYAPETGADHVPDPYYSRDFDGALDLVEAAAAGLKRALYPGA
ncbi:low molecular weight protein-tyrosine-phosphatase [Antarcticimicrobium luteum]|uniref:protein-tyrosine-phosphatase n=1 Tax=Antarcticimicrobium luteum TaxID=2547397 RepID=A0A4R5UT53_9RHOB|nr:low molecular weight protein-tyrosine-phosphatase [Antarcticimicrobium luteum]TDK42195.1 low molecular weight phosphotyrosine protein phosphatase [Antarcticimicrobium luteum]